MRTDDLTSFVKTGAAEARPPEAEEGRAWKLVLSNLEGELAKYDYDLTVLEDMPSYAAQDEVNKVIYLAMRRRGVPVSLEDRAWSGYHDLGHVIDARTDEEYLRDFRPTIHLEMACDKFGLDQTIALFTRHGVPHSLHPQLWKERRYSTPRHTAEWLQNLNKGRGFTELDMDQVRAIASHLRTDFPESPAPMGERQPAVATREGLWALVQEMVAKVLQEPGETVKEAWVPLTSKHKRTLVGAGLGAATGAAVGATSAEKGKKLKRGLIGAGVGGGVGALAGRGYHAMKPVPEYFGGVAQALDNQSRDFHFKGQERLPPTPDLPWSELEKWFEKRDGPERHLGDVSSRTNKVLLDKPNVRMRRAGDAFDVQLYPNERDSANRLAPLWATAKMEDTPENRRRLLEYAKSLRSKVTDRTFPDLEKTAGKPRYLRNRDPSTLTRPAEPEWRPGGPSRQDVQTYKRLEYLDSRDLEKKVREGGDKWDKAQLQRSRHLLKNRAGPVEHRHRKLHEFLQEKVRTGRPKEEMLWHKQTLENQRYHRDIERPARRAGIDPVTFKKQRDAAAAKAQEAAAKPAPAVARRAAEKVVASRPAAAPAAQAVAKKVVAPAAAPVAQQAAAKVVASRPANPVAKQVAEKVVASRPAPTTAPATTSAAPRTGWRPTGRQMAIGGAVIGGTALAGYGVHRLLRARRERKAQEASMQKQAGYLNDKAVDLWGAAARRMPRLTHAATNVATNTPSASGAGLVAGVAGAMRPVAQRRDLARSLARHRTTARRVRQQTGKVSLVRPTGYGHARRAVAQRARGNTAAATSHARRSAATLARQRGPATRRLGAVRNIAAAASQMDVTASVEKRAFGFIRRKGGISNAPTKQYRGNPAYKAYSALRRGRTAASDAGQDQRMVHAPAALRQQIRRFGAPQGAAQVESGGKIFKLPKPPQPPKPPKPPEAPEAPAMKTAMAQEHFDALAPGDIVLMSPQKSQRPTRRGRLFDRGFVATSKALQGSFTHAGIYVGDGEMVEARIGQGVMKTDIRKQLATKKYKIVAPKNDKLRRRAVTFAERQVGKDYDNTGLAATGLGMLTPDPAVSLVGKKLIRAREREEYTCSNLIDAAYKGKLTPEGFATAPVDFEDSSRTVSKAVHGPDKAALIGRRAGTMAGHAIVPLAVAALAYGAYRRGQKNPKTAAVRGKRISTALVMRRRAQKEVDEEQSKTASKLLAKTRWRDRPKVLKQHVERQLAGTKLPEGYSFGPVKTRRFLGVMAPDATIPIRAPDGSDATQKSWAVPHGATVSLKRRRKGTWDVYGASLYLKPEHRKKGIGGAVMQAGLRAGRSLGAKNMKILAADQGTAAWAKHPGARFDFKEGDDHHQILHAQYAAWRKKHPEAPALSSDARPQRFPSKFLLQEQLHNEMMVMPYRIPLQKQAAVAPSKIHGKGFFTDESGKTAKDWDDHLQGKLLSGREKRARELRELVLPLLGSPSPRKLVSAAGQVKKNPVLRRQAKDAFHAFVSSPDHARNFSALHSMAPKKPPSELGALALARLAGQFITNPKARAEAPRAAEAVLHSKAAAIRDSEIHGKGFFTDGPVKKGKAVAVAFDERGMQTSEGKKTNHSPRPTAEVKKKGKARFMVALRDLDAGEEVTVDYRTLYIPEKGLKGVAPKGSKTGRGVLPSMPSATTDKILKSVRKANRTPPALRRKRRGWARKGT